VGSSLVRQQRQQLSRIDGMLLTVAGADPMSLFAGCAESPVSCVEN
jgi:hypothetical protein